MTEKVMSRRRIAAAQPIFSEADRATIARAIDDVLRSGRLILGEHTAQFEADFKRAVGTEHAVAVASCTAALQIVLRYYGVAGREVLLPTNNFPGVVSAVLYENGVPVFADMDPRTFSADPDDLVARITPRTAGVVLVHIAGIIDPAVDRIYTACRERGLFVIEDASHAHGARLDSRPAGSLANAGCFSFYPTKILTAMTGGMITTNDARLADFARCLRHHGMGKTHGEFVALGHDWCLSEVHAIVGRAQLAHLDAFVAHRNAAVEWYREALAGDQRFAFPRPAAGSGRHAYYKLPLLLSDRIPRDEFRRTVWEEFGLENGTVYDPPCHLQPLFRDRLGYAPGALPAAEAALGRQFCPPVHSAISRDDVEWCVQAMRMVANRWTD